MWAFIHIQHARSLAHTQREQTAHHLLELIAIEFGSSAQMLPVLQIKKVTDP